MQSEYHVSFYTGDPISLHFIKTWIVGRREVHVFELRFCTLGYSETYNCIALIGNIILLGFISHMCNWQMDLHQPHAPQRVIQIT